MGSFHHKRQAPGNVSQERARGCQRHPRVWGVGFGQLKGQARNRWTGSEHAARKDLMILKVTGLIWSMNAALSRLFGRQTLGAVKKPPEICEFCEAGPQCRHRSAKIPCRKIRQTALFA